MLHNTCFFLLVLILSSCTAKKAADAVNTDSTAAIHDDSVFILHGRQWQTTVLSDRAFFCLVDHHGDTLIKEYGVSDFSFQNFDDDGLLDLKLSYFTNVPGIEDVFLYRADRKVFLKVEDLSAFPASRRLKNTPYYYSYHRSGCADSNWGSDLFYIKDLKTYCIAEIAAYQCGYTDPKDGIYISKVKGNLNTLVETLPIDTISSYKDYKWGFIDDYWMKHYRKFVESDTGS